MGNRKAAEMTPDALAEVFHETLEKRTSKGAFNCVCRSEDEAVLVAHRLRKRGWKAEALEGVSLKTGEGSYAVRITGKLRNLRKDETIYDG